MNIQYSLFNILDDFKRKNSFDQIIVQYEVDFCIKIFPNIFSILLTYV